MRMFPVRGGSLPRGGYAMSEKTRLTLRIALVSALALTVLALVLGTVLSRFLERSVQVQAQRFLVTRVESRARSIFTPTDFDLPRHGKDWERFQKKVARFADGEGLAEVRLYSPRGLIVWSEDRAQVGESFSGNPELARALRGEVDVVIQRPAQPRRLSEGTASPQLMDVYIPIRWDSQTSAAPVVKITRDMTSLAETLSHGYRTIWSVLGGGLGVLFLLLLGTALSAERTIQSQARHLREKTRSLEEATLDTIRVLVTAIEAKDPYTVGHSARVASYAKRIAGKLGLDRETVATVEKAALFHDVGKIRTPPEILHKPGPLDPDQFAVMRNHPADGAAIMARARSLAKYARILRAHHERPDGLGYPDGLRGEEIPIEAAIISVADSYDAMFTDRPYRKALAIDEVITEFEKGCGTQFDAQVVDALLGLIKTGWERRSGRDRPASSPPYSGPRRSGEDRRNASLALSH